MLTCGNEDAHDRDEDFCNGVDGPWEENTEEQDGSEEAIAVKAIVQIQVIRHPRLFGGSEA